MVHACKVRGISGLEVGGGERVIIVEPLEALYRAESKQMRSVAWMILGSRAAAEDVVQECFARLTLKDLSSIDRPGAYLRTCIVNECRTQLRIQARYAADAEAPELLHLDADVSGFYDTLKSLSARKRTVIVLRYWCDLPVNEIAELLDCRPGTVSSLLHRALKELKEVL